MTVRDYATQCIKDEAQALLDLIPQLDDNFDHSVELILACHGKVIVTGVGKSGHIGAKIAATLSSTGTPSFFINPLDVYHGDLGVMTPDDVVLAISNSGQTDELLRFIPMLQHMKVPIIGMSGNPGSLLAKYSTYHINVKHNILTCFQLLFHLCLQRSVITVLIYFLILQKFVVLNATTEFLRRKKEIFHSVLLRTTRRTAGSRNRKCKIQILRQQIIDNSRFART